MSGLPFEVRVQRAPTLTEQVYETLRDSIIEGKLLPGERLVFEQLAPRFGVSQTPVREAIIRLVHDGLAETGPDGKLHVIGLTEEYVSDIFLVRSVLEGFATELAAARLSDADLAALRALLEDAARVLNAGDAEAYGETVGEFHQRIRDAAGSATLTSELRRLNAHVSFIFAYARRQVARHHVRSEEEHWEILGALCSRDPVAARRVVEAHTRNARERVIDILRAARE